MNQPEDRLLSVVGHWLPRIEVAGIPSATARHVIERAGSWEGWLAAWCEEGERHATIGDEALAAGHRQTAGEAYARASLFCHFGQFMAFEDLVAKTRAATRKVELYRRAAPLMDFPGTFLEVPFEGGVIHGCLRQPKDEERAPLAVIIPGSDSTKEEFPAFEQHFLTRGIATLSMDGPGQGEGRAHGDLRPDFGSAVASMVDLAREQDGLSGDLALVGMAFGGHIALRAASAADAAATVSINGFFDFGDFWASLPQVYRDNMRFALGGPNVEARARRFSLAGKAPPATPTLIIHGGRDTIFPPEQAEKCAAWCGEGSELRIFPDGNHVCNNIPWAYRPLVADWLSDQFRIQGRRR